MKDEEILKKAIEKAVKNGFEYDLVNLWDITKVALKLNKASCYDIIFSHSFPKAFWGEKVELSDINIPCKKCGRKMWLTEECGSSRWYSWFACNYCGNHFGEKRSGEIIKNKIKEGWQYHLQRMVLEKEPLKYIEKFL